MTYWSLSCVFCNFRAGEENLYITVVPDSKVHWANMGPIWGEQDPGGPHVGPMNFAIWGCYSSRLIERA